MSTFEHWYYNTSHKDELDVIFTGWFCWMCDDAADLINAIEGV